MSDKQIQASPDYGPYDTGLDASKARAIADANDTSDLETVLHHIEQEANNGGYSCYFPGTIQGRTQKILEAKGFVLSVLGSKYNISWEIDE